MPQFSSFRDPYRILQLLSTQNLAHHLSVEDLESEEIITGLCKTPYIERLWKRGKNIIKYKIRDFGKRILMQNRL